MKKKILCLMCFALSLCGTAYADTVDTEFLKDSSVLRIYGELGEENAYARVSAIVMKGEEKPPAQNEEDFVNGVTGVMSDAVAFSVCTGDKYGNYEFSPITISGYSGEATVYVGIYNGNALFEKKVFLSGSNDILSFVNNINTANSAAEIKNILDDESKNPKFGADLTYFNQLSADSKKKVGEFMLDEQEAGRYAEDNESRIENADSDVLLASILAYTSEKSDWEMLKQLINIEDSVWTESKKAVFEEILELDSLKESKAGLKAFEAEDSLYQMIIKNSFFNVDEFKDAVVTGVINYELGTISSWSDVSSILEAYKDDLEGLDYSELSKKNETKKAMMAIHEGVPYASIENLIDEINDILDEEYATSSGSGSSGGGGGGGAGGGSSYVSVGAILGTTLSGVSNPTTEPTKVPVTGTENKTFADLPAEHWAYEAVMSLSEKGIVSGIGNNCFEPERNITREEFVQMLVNAFVLADDTAKHSFTDVAEGAWYEKAIASAVEKDIIKGIDESNFGIGQNITRQDMAVIAYRTMQNVWGVEAEETMLTFTDSELISEYAQEAVSYMFKNNIVSGMGDNTFAPQNTATRAQAAKIIYCLLNYAI